VDEVDVNRLQDLHVRSVCSRRPRRGGMWAHEALADDPAARDCCAPKLKRLKSADRPRVIKAIAEARSHGDLSERRRVSRRPREQQGLPSKGGSWRIESRLAAAEIIDIASSTGDRQGGVRRHG